jgi:Protein of unknown function (DUF2452)
MSDSLTRYSGPNHVGAASTSPYGQSRMAPAIELVDVAKEIAQANALIGAATADKLGLIAEQIRALQEQARVILEKARRDVVLHTAECRFQKVAGQTYHLYRKGDGDAARYYFSMLSPDDWRGHPPDPFEGTYRVEADLSFSSNDELAQRDARLSTARKLLGGGL